MHAVYPIASILYTCIVLARLIIIWNCSIKSDLTTTFKNLNQKNSVVTSSVPSFKVVVTSRYQIYQTTLYHSVFFLGSYSRYPRQNFPECFAFLNEALVIWVAMWGCIIFVLSKEWWLRAVGLYSQKHPPEEALGTWLYIEDQAKTHVNHKIILSKWSCKY